MVGSSGSSVVAIAISIDPVSDQCAWLSQKNFDDVDGDIRRDGLAWRGSLEKI